MQVEISERQFGQAWAAERIRHKPFVVAVRVPTIGGGPEYHVRNIGPGLAVSVWHVQVSNGDFSSCIEVKEADQIRSLTDILQAESAAIRAALARPGPIARDAAR